VYRAFESLRRKGYVRTWTVVPSDHRGGRTRGYYELTQRGMAAAERQHLALVALLDLPTRRRSSAESDLETWWATRG
jgi:DNA-binding PadR family transcriptional regulator